MVMKVPFDVKRTTRKAKLDWYSKMCDKKRLPDFLPYMGYCSSCGYDFVRLIFPEYGEEDFQYITECPKCHASLVE